MNLEVEEIIPLVSSGGGPVDIVDMVRSYFLLSSTFLFILFICIICLSYKLT